MLTRQSPADNFMMEKMLTPEENADQSFQIRQECCRFMERDEI